MSRLRVFALLLVAFPLSAQTTTGIGVGGVLPLGNLARIDAVGYHVTAAWQTIPPLRSMGFRVDGSHSAMNRKATIQHITEQIASVTGGPVVRFPRIGASYGYAMATLGAYFHWTNPEPVGARAATDLGIGAGIGCRFSLGHRAAFAEARYHRIMSGTTEGPRFVPLAIGLLF